MLVKEDGTGQEAANVYADAATAQAFHGDRGTIDRWAAFVDLGQAVGSLLAATEMLDATYRWRGEILSPDQGLRLPRHSFLDHDHKLLTPAMQIAKAADACALLALHLLEHPVAGPGVAAETFPDYSISYAAGGSTRVAWPDVHAILAGMTAAGSLAGGMTGAQLVRWS